MGEKILKVGSATPVRTWDPREVQDSVSALCLMQAFETPYAPPPDLTTPPEPLLFDGHLELERGGDRPVLSARVRRGVVFADGTPLAPEHVIRSLATVEGFRNHAEAHSRDERVVFTLRRPHPRFDLFLSNHICSVVAERGSQLLGTGPFALAEGSSGEHVRLVRNPFYRHAVPLDEIHFLHVSPERGESLVEALGSGSVHFSVDLSRDDLGRLDSVCKWFQPGVSTASLYFNTEAETLRDPRVRRALCLAIDRQSLARISYHNAVAFTASGLLPPIMGGGFSDGIEHDPAAAKELLEAAGVARTRLRLLTPWGPRLYLPHPEQIAESIREQLAAVGVELVLHPSRDIVDFYEQTCEPEYELGLIGWVPNSLDPRDFLEVTLASYSIPVRGRSQAVRSNFARWSDPVTDRLLALYLESGRETTKHAILGRVARETPLLPLVYGPSIAAHSPRLTGFVPMPIAYHNRFAAVDLLAEPRRAAR